MAAYINNGTDDKGQFEEYTSSSGNENSDCESDSTVCSCGSGSSSSTDSSCHNCSTVLVAPKKKLTKTRDMNKKSKYFKHKNQVALIKPVVEEFVDPCLGTPLIRWVRGGSSESDDNDSLLEGIADIFDDDDDDDGDDDDGDDDDNAADDDDDDNCDNYIEDSDYDYDDYIDINIYSEATADAAFIDNTWHVQLHFNNRESYVEDSREKYVDEKLPKLKCDNAINLRTHKKTRKNSKNKCKVVDVKKGVEGKETQVKKHNKKQKTVRSARPTHASKRTKNKKREKSYKSNKIPPPKQKPKCQKRKTKHTHQNVKGNRDFVSKCLQ